MIFHLRKVASEIEQIIIPIDARNTKGTSQLSRNKNIAIQARITAIVT